MRTMVPNLGESNPCAESTDQIQLINRKIIYCLALHPNSQFFFRKQDLTKVLEFQAGRLVLMQSGICQIGAKFAVVFRMTFFAPPITTMAGGDPE